MKVCVPGIESNEQLGTFILQPNVIFVIELSAMLRISTGIADQYLQELTDYSPNSPSIEIQLSKTIRIKARKVACPLCLRLGQQVEQDGEVVAGAAAKHEQMPDHVAER